MHTRYVTIPPLASIVTSVRDERKGTTDRQSVELPFETIVLDIWTVHPSFAKGLASLDAAIRIRGAFRGKKPGEVVSLDEDAWTRFASVVRADDSGLPATIAILLREASPEYFDCVLDAPTVLPAVRNARA